MTMVSWVGAVAVLLDGAEQRPLVGSDDLEVRYRYLDTPVETVGQRLTFVAHRPPLLEDNRL
jgi:hypothetical protein